MTPAALKKWREDKGLTQAAAAREIGITTRQWQKLEAGDHPIRRIHSLALLALSSQALRNAAPAATDSGELEKAIETAINAFDQINEKTPWSETEPQWWLSMMQVQRQLKAALSKKREG